MIPWDVYGLLNTIAFLAYGWDKHRARTGERRTAESTLLLLAFLGAFGGLAGMLAFRHKIRRPRFKLVYPFVVIHATAIAWSFAR